MRMLFYDVSLILILLNLKDHLCYFILSFYYECMFRGYRQCSCLFFMLIVHSLTCHFHGLFSFNKSYRLFLFFFRFCHFTSFYEAFCHPHNLISNYFLYHETPPLIQYFHYRINPNYCSLYEKLER